MKKNTVFLLLLSFETLHAQQSLNLAFEKALKTAKEIRPSGWNFPDIDPNYHFTTDSVVRHEGRYAGLLYSVAGSAVKEGWNNVNHFLPGDRQGKIIEFKGWLKTDSVTGYAGLWLRLNGAGGAVLGFDNMQKKGLRGTKDWTPVSIRLKLPPQTTGIAFGILLVGKGRVWMDDMQMLINGKDYHQAPHKERPLAARDSAFYKGSGIRLDDPSPQQLQNLEILGHVWGFLKYYHPAPNSGKYNWDFELFRIMPAVLAANDKSALSDTLLKWIRKYGAVPLRKERLSLAAGKVDFSPDFGWMDNDSWFTPALKNELHYILQNRFTGEHYYVDVAPNVGNPVIKNEAPYGRMKYPDTGFRLLCLYRYWNLINYFYPYKNVIGTDWNTVLQDFMPRFISAEDTLSYTLTVWNLINSVHDTHANIWGINTVRDNFVGSYKAPFQVRFAGDTAVVFHIVEAPSVSGMPLKRGDIITAINGQDIRQFIKSKWPYHCASNDRTGLRNIRPFIQSSSFPDVTLTVSRNGREETLNVHYLPDSSFNRRYYEYDDDLDTAYCILNDSIGYLSLGKITKKDVNKAFKLFKNTKGIIIDDRVYPGDFPIYQICWKLYPHPKPAVKFTSADLNMPGRFVFGKPLTFGRENRHYYKGKVAILVNEHTQSSAEYHSMMFGQAPHAKVFGSTTAGADGNVSQFTLPGGITTLFSGIGVFYADGTPTQRIGIRPDVTVKPTVESIREGKDIVMQEALKWIKK